MFAMVNDQGTGCAETGICNRCYGDSASLAFAASRAWGDIDRSKGFVDVTGNEAIDCVVCGAEAEEEIELRETK